MYKIYYEGTLILDDTSTAEEIQLLDTTFKQAANSAGSLEFTMYSNNVAYDSIQRMRGLVKVYKNENLIWEGRVLSEKTDFWKRKQIYCEGVLACLNDTRQPQIVYSDLPLRSYIESILSIHNQKVDDSKKFETGIVTVNDGAMIGTRATNYDSTWDIFKGLVDEFGGYLYVRYTNGHRYLDYRKQCPRTSSQKIEFGVNLMDFTKTYDMSTLCTVLLPLGQVTTQAGGSSVGNVIDSRIQSGYYLDDNYEIQYDANLVGHYNGSSSYFTVQAGKTYYISCRNHDSRAMWALRDSGFNLIDTYSASSGEGMTDLIESAIEVPKSDAGANYQLAIAGFGYDIQPRVNESIEASKEFDKYTTVESVNNGSLYVTNKSAVTTYGWIEKQLTWANITDPSELKTLAEKYLTEGQFDEMSLDVKALDLQSIGVDTDRIDILDEIQVVSEPHGLNKVFPVTELTVKIGDPSGTTFTLGSKTEQSLTGLVSSTNDEIYAKLNQVPSRSAILESARNNATMLINNTLSGIFMLEQNDDGTNIGFRISNVEDWDSEGAKGWRFTMGGLGFFGDGFDKPVTLALTGEDGGIVANCITAGTMYADRIHGGTLTLGGYNNDNGLILVRDSDSRVVCIVDNTGFYTVNAQGLWLRMANGALTGGEDFGDTQLASMSTSAGVLDGDSGQFYKGIGITSDVVYLGCDFFAIDGATGTSGWMTFVGDVDFEMDEIEVVTDVRVINGELDVTRETIKYVSGWSWTKNSFYFHKGIMCTGLDDAGDAMNSGGGSSGKGSSSGGGTLSTSDYEKTSGMPMTFNGSAGVNLVDYKIWGNDGGVGVQHGEEYLIPVRITNGLESKIIDIHISAPLMKGDYLVYSEQKIYRGSDGGGFDLGTGDDKTNGGIHMVVSGDTVTYSGTPLGGYVSSLRNGIQYLGSHPNTVRVGYGDYSENGHAFKLTNGMTYTFHGDPKDCVHLLVGKLGSSVTDGTNPAKRIFDGQSFDVTNDETYCMPILFTYDISKTYDETIVPRFGDIDVTQATLPAIPTYESNNTISVTTGVQPEKMYIKYKIRN